MRASVHIDPWKLPIFERHLQQSGLGFERHAGVVPDSLMLIVFFDDEKEVINVVRQANLEAHAKGPSHGH
jgi:hypothetical protein